MSQSTSKRAACATAARITRRAFIAGAAGALALAAGTAIAATSGSSSSVGGSAASSSASQQSTSAASSKSGQQAFSGRSAASGTGSNGAAADKSGSAPVGRVLLAYFSGMGHTERAAQIVEEVTGADVFVIEPAKPYTEEDQDFNDDSSRVSIEHRDASQIDNTLSKYAPDNWDDYDTVILGYPIWWMDASWAMQGFASGNDFTGKTIIPFCTSYSSPVGKSVQTLADLAGTGDWQDGTRFQQDFEDDEVREWTEGLEL